VSKLYKLKIALPVGVRDPLDISHGGTLRCMIDYRIPARTMGTLFYVSRVGVCCCVQTKSPTLQKSIYSELNFK
jgi:hypothetical protein